MRNRERRGCSSVLDICRAGARASLRLWMRSRSTASWWSLACSVIWRNTCSFAVRQRPLAARYLQYLRASVSAVTRRRLESLRLQALQQRCRWRPRRRRIRHRQRDVLRRSAGLQRCIEFGIVRRRWAMMAALRRRRWQRRRATWSAAEAGAAAHAQCGKQRSGDGKAGACLDHRRSPWMDAHVCVVHARGRAGDARAFVQQSLACACAAHVSRACRHPPSAGVRRHALIAPLPLLHKCAIANASVLDDGRCHADGGVSGIFRQRCHHRSAKARSECGIVGLIEGTRIGR